MGRSREAGACPDRAALQAAAGWHLERYGATAAGLLRVLERRILRWQAAAGGSDEDVAAARAVAREVVSATVAAGLVDDAAYAEARARRLVRRGRSRRAVSAHLAAKGVGGDVAAAALPDAATELQAAVALARRRRVGPFAGEAAVEPGRALGVFARAGFGREVAERVLRMDPAEAAGLLAELTRS